jgi:Uma2 family endonuclease
MSVVAKVPVYMSVQEFLVWDSGDNLRYELVDGEPRAMAPANTIHGFLQNELGRLIGNHLRDGGSKCKALANPGVIPHLLAAHNFRIPDLGVTCAPLIPGQPAMIEPILLVEILSPSNQADTWSNVWAYTSIASLREILVLYSNRSSAKILRRGPDGNWPTEPLEYKVGDLQLFSIDFKISLQELYRDTGLLSRI